MRLLRNSTLGALLAMLAACGGGGGNNTPATSFAVNTNAVTFTAVSTATAPTPQAVTASVNGNLTGTLFVLIEVLSGTNVVSVSTVTLNGNSGQATVIPALPAALGVGTFTSMLRVRACLNDSSCATGQLPGSPQTITVTYTITAPGSGTAPTPNPTPDPQPTPMPNRDTSRDVVAPRVGVPNVGSQLILRGAALTGISSVGFRPVGSTVVTAASSVTQVSSTEVRVTYPALAAGNYDVVLNAGAVPFAGSVVMVPTPAFQPTELKFPEQPDRISALLYDAERNRLLVGTASPAAPSNNKLFVFSGAVLTRSVQSFANLRDFTLSADGTRLLAVTDSEVLELDAGTLAVLRRVPAPAISGTARLQRIAVANDGKAIISTGALNLTAANPAFLYDTVTRAFDSAPLTMLNSSSEDRPPGMVATADGSHIYITQSTSTLLPTAQAILDYSASSGTLESSGPFIIAHTPDQPLATDQSGDFVLPYNAAAPVKVLNGSFNQAGVLNDFVPVAVAVNRLGTRAYLLDNSNMFHNFGLVRGAASNTAFTEVDNSTIITTPGAGGTSIKSEVTPDGATVFMAGVRAVIVIPKLK